MNSHNLQSVSSHLKLAPGSFLSSLRSRFTKKSGLIQNTKILGEICEEILKPERIKKYLSEKTEWERLVLHLIYASGTRGVHFAELQSNFEIPPKIIADFLTEAANEMLIWHAKSKRTVETDHIHQYIYFGFTDFYNLFENGNFLTTAEVPENNSWISNGRLAEWHLISILAMSQIGKFSVKKDNYFTHWTIKYLSRILARHKSMDASLAEDETHLLFAFLIDEKWLLRNEGDGELRPSATAYEFLQKNGFRLYSELLFWWERERFRNKDDLKTLLKFFEKPVDSLTAARLFWAFDTRSRLPKDSNITWAMLPRPLRELYLLGILKASANKKKVFSFELSELGEDVIFGKHYEKFEVPICSCSSNFEWLMSISNGALKLFQIACFAQVKNDEEPLRFVINRESFFEGLRSQLPKGYVEDFIAWNLQSQNVAATLNDWNEIFNISTIDTVRLLKIRNANRLKELSEYKPFLECVEESIPNYGFVIKQECEQKVRSILSHFSLNPAPPALHFSATHLGTLAGTENYKVPFPSVDSNEVLF
ncbi:hypothetical protein AGMMS49938_02170 [Fibrobacterales bacterium]|nr:hypothetical protein AGMMS49938_02170 [Fibrobacterales bacterium]